MASKQDLGYLGEDFQYKLIHTFFENKEFFKDLNNIIDQNMFTNPQLKVVVGVMKDYYDKEEAVPSYELMGIALNEKAHNDIERETYKEIIKKIINTPSDGVDYIRDLAKKFFKQQHIIKTANEILKIAGDGDTDKYEKCVELLNDALSKGNQEELGNSVFDDIGETLSDDYRTPIPTGIGKLDEALEGGLGKGELGVIIGPTSFGKALSVNALIATPKGFVKNSDLKLGDYVMGCNGEKTKVIGIFPQGKRKMYKVVFSDGISILCDIEHLWSVEHNNTFKTLSLNDIMKNGIKENNEFIFSIPLCKPIKFDYKGIKYNPYNFGYYAYFNNVKNIQPFICNSVKIRQEILQGIMDNYGYLDNENFPIIKIQNLNKHFIKQLLYSLGGFILHEDDDILKFILNDSNIKLFSLHMNQSKVIYNTDNKYKRYIIDIIEDIEDDAQCIKVDADDELYVTENFIVTHNTSLTTAMASYAATYKCPQNNNKGYKVLQIVFEDRIKQIQRKHLGRITGIEAKDLSKAENKEYVKEQLEKYEDKEMLSENLRIVRFPSGEKTANDIYRFIKKLINTGFKPDLTIIDYFECLSHDCFFTTGNDYDKEGKTMRKLESIASELDMALWIPSQGTKESINLELVTMDKMGGSVKKSQVAHIIMSIARTVEDIENNKATIALLKNRAGKSGKVFNNVMFNNGTCRISTDNVDEFDNMLDYNKNAQEEKMNLIKNVYKISQSNKLKK